uniref:Uncharacterized protein n=1 Tax=Romanomermis culicivorax TaxID=13658 RepID=A0A915IBM8_ROMCU
MWRQKIEAEGSVVLEFHRRVRVYTFITRLNVETFPGAFAIGRGQNRHFRCWKGKILSALSAESMNTILTTLIFGLNASKFSSKIGGVSQHLASRSDRAVKDPPNIPIRPPVGLERRFLNPKASKCLDMLLKCIKKHP